MDKILGKQTIIEGPQQSFAGPIAFSVLASAAQNEPLVICFVVDDITGLSIVRSFQEIDRIRDTARTNVVTIAPALTLQDLMRRINAVEPHDGKTALVVCRDFSRDATPLEAGNLWLNWQAKIAQEMHARTLTIASHADHFPAPLDHAAWDTVYTIKDGHPAPPKERWGIKYNLVQTKGGDRTVHLVGTHQGACFEERTDGGPVHPLLL